MLQINNPYANGYYGRPDISSPQGDPFHSIGQNVERCACPRHRRYVEENRDDICNRIRGRNPYQYRTDNNGYRYENGRPALTQVQQQNDTSATLQVGNNKLTVDQTRQMLTVQNADGSQKEFSLSWEGDPHVKYNGQDIGTMQRNVGVTLADGSMIHLLMGDGNGGPPKPGMPTYVETIGARATDGTGALITNVSNRNQKLGVTPLDSSYAAHFMQQQAFGRFGEYEASHVAMDPYGRFYNQSNGEFVHDQQGLDRLDQDQINQVNQPGGYQGGWQGVYQNTPYGQSQGNPYDQFQNGQYGPYSHFMAGQMYNQGYVPPYLANQFGRPQSQYDDSMRQQCHEQLQQMIYQYLQAQQNFQGLGEISQPVARYWPGDQGYQSYFGYGQTA